MNHVLSQTYNLDSKIQELQTILYNQLVVLWGTDKIDAYGRVYKNEGDKGVMPQVYDSVTKNYKHTIYNGQSCFFFVDDDNHPLEDQDHEFTTDVKIVFMLNLKDLKTTTERADADVKRDVTVILKKEHRHGRVKEYIQGLDNVLRGFNTDELKHHQMQPYFVFAINTSWSYTVI